MVGSRDHFSICVFLSKQGEKLKSERVSWLSKIWALYFMTDLGSILSFLISGFNNTDNLSFEAPRRRPHFHAVKGPHPIFSPT